MDRNTRLFYFFLKKGVDRVASNELKDLTVLHGGDTKKGTFLMNWTEMNEKDQCVEKMKGFVEWACDDSAVEHARRIVSILESWGVTNRVSLAVAWGHVLGHGLDWSKGDCMGLVFEKIGGKDVCKGLEQFADASYGMGLDSRFSWKVRGILPLPMDGKIVSRETLIVLLADMVFHTREIVQTRDLWRAWKYFRERFSFWDRGMDSRISDIAIAEKETLLSAFKETSELFSDGHVEVVFVVDRSASMKEFVEPTIREYNEMLEAQRQGKRNVKVTTILFDEGSKFVGSHVDISKVKPLTQSRYRPKGGSALIDAATSAILFMENAQNEHAPKRMAASKVLFVMITKGLEDASYRYSIDKLKELIRQKRELFQWEFVFTRADIDSIPITDWKEYSLLQQSRRTRMRSRIPLE